MRQPAAHHPESVEAPVDATVDAPLDDPADPTLDVAWTAPDPAAAHPFLHRLEEVAGWGPDRTAIVGGEGSLTYADLVRVAAGTSLLDSSAPVAVCGRDLPAMAAAVAVLGAGRPLALLDPSLPSERAQAVLNLSGADLMLVEAGCEAPPTDVATRVIDAAWLAAVIAAAPPGPLPLRPGTETDAPASLVFTSGSTGMPKGVPLSHGAVVNGARISAQEMRLGPADRCALVLPFAYAAGQEVLFMSILNGTTVVVRDLRDAPIRTAGEWLRSERISTLHTTPSLLRHLTGALAHTTVAGIRLFTTCGEPVHRRDIEAAQHWMPRADYANYVGSSETGHLSFFHARAGDLAALPEGYAPAGTAVDGKEMWTVDENEQRLAPGSPGRLRVRSRFIALGYWANEAATADAFERDEGDPHAPRTFRSGDRATVGDDRSVRLHGREDDAVKIRGYLVEPAEVEAALRALHDVTDVAVVVDRTQPAGALIAYVAPEPGARRPAPADLRGRLRDSLPHWMIPHTIVLLAELPRNERGKVDRTRLPEPPRAATPQPPSDQWQALVAEIWADVLGLHEVGRTEDFFALGADSLTVEEMLARFGDHQVRVTATDLAAAPTLEAFARVVRQRSGARRRHASGPLADGTADGIRVSLRAGEGGTPVYLFGGAGGPAFLFADLVRLLPQRTPVEAFQVRGLARRALPDWSVQRAARRYVAAILEDRPRGSVVLAGHSLGGLFAVESARMLREAGVEVELLQVIDTVVPGHLARLSGAARPEIRVAGGARQSRGELWRTRFQLLGLGWYPFETSVRDQLFFQHGLRVTERYRPTGWSGRTEIYCSADNVDDRAWWSHLATGDHDLHEVPSDHLGILREPWVNQIADRMRQTLDRMDADLDPLDAR